MTYAKYILTAVEREHFMARVFLVVECFVTWVYR